MTFCTCPHGHSDPFVADCQCRHVHENEIPLFTNETIAWSRSVPVLPSNALVRQRDEEGDGMPYKADAVRRRNVERPVSNFLFEHQNQAPSVIYSASCLLIFRLVSSSFSVYHPHRLIIHLASPSCLVIRLALSSIVPYHLFSLNDSLSHIICHSTLSSSITSSHHLFHLLVNHHILSASAAAAS